jgi:hypothetical protein
MAQLSELGLTVDLPQGWDARLFSREAGDGTARVALHAGTFPLPSQRGDFGSGAVEAMTPDDVLVVLLEYDRGCTEKPLFQNHGLPSSLEAGQFSSSVLQRALPGQAGAQVFFCDSGRAFCLYVVLGSQAGGRYLVPLANSLLGRITLEG